MKRKNLKKPMISALEQRILFDGAAVETALDVLDNSSFSSNESSSSNPINNDATKNNAENSVHEAQAVQGFERLRKEVAFVDVTVKDYQTLVDGIGAGVETYLVSSMNDIKSILETQKDIDAIHILSHGNTGEITVGNDVLNKDSLDNYNELLQNIKTSLTADGDLLLYGCNVASDGSGQEFINEIANITQADVAASDDATGNSALGGDWDLEVKVGLVSEQSLVIDKYEHDLSVVNISFTPSSTDGNSEGTNGIWGQSFTATKTGTISYLKLLPLTAAQSDITLNIYSGESVSGSPLYTQSISQGSLNHVATSTDISEYSTITITGTVNIVSGQKYTFVFGNGNPFEFYYTSDGTSSGGYSGGSLYTSQYGGFISGYDALFVIGQGDAVDTTPPNI